jgi:hypothetical protein
MGRGYAGRILLVSEQVGGVGRSATPVLGWMGMSLRSLVLSSPTV